MKLSNHPFFLADSATQQLSSSATIPFFLADNEYSNLQALSWECCRLVYVFSDINLFFLTELKNFHIHSISVTFPNLKSNQNDIRKFHDFPDFPELSKSLICKLECNYNLIHAACLFNKLINFPAALSTKYTKENFLQVFHVWFSVKYRKCT